MADNKPQYYEDASLDGYLIFTKRVSPFAFLKGSFDSDEEGFDGTKIKKEPKQAPIVAPAKPMNKQAKQTYTTVVMSQWKTLLPSSDEEEEEEEPQDDVEQAPGITAYEEELRLKADDCWDDECERAEGKAHMAHLFGSDLTVADTNQKPNKSNVSSEKFSAKTPKCSSDELVEDEAERVAGILAAVKKDSYKENPLYKRIRMRLCMYCNHYPCITLDGSVHSVTMEVKADQ